MSRYSPTRELDKPNPNETRFHGLGWVIRLVQFFTLHLITISSGIKFKDWRPEDPEPIQCYVNENILFTQRVRSLDYYVFRVYNYKFHFYFYSFLLFKCTPTMSHYYQSHPQPDLWSSDQPTTYRFFLHAIYIHFLPKFTTFCFSYLSFHIFLK